MGSQIAILCALAGYEVALQDIDEGMLEKAEAELRGRVSRSVERGRLKQGEMDGAFGRMTFSTDLASSASDADFVIEAIVESLDAKRDLFEKLDNIAPAHAIFTTNTSSIKGSLIAEVTQRPDRVCNMHFFNPPLVMECVEIVHNPDASEATVETVAELARRIGKTPVILKREIPGFIANRILSATFDEAIRLYEGGYASVEDIDTICKTALRHPMGAFELMDLGGIDVNYHMRMSLFEQTEDPRDKPPKSIVEKFESNEFGRKTGKGFYEYG